VARDDVIARRNLRRERRTEVLEREERLIGMRAVGAPVLGDDEVLAAVSVSGPTTRMNGEWYREEVPGIATQAARTIGIRATHP
jgi:DNA-binding IclR family transcriptional regulator